MSQEQVLGPGMIGGFRLWRKHLSEVAHLYRSHNLVVSYPKSGRTWHRVMLCRYISTVFKDGETRSVDTEKLAKETGLARISYTNDGAKFVYAVPPLHRINGDPLVWRGRKIVLLIRDPRDVLVSAYAHAVQRSRSFTGPISDFIRHPFTGVEKILVAQKRWHQFRPRARDVLVLKYEDMHRDPSAALVATLNLMGIAVHSEAVAEAVAFAQFDNMKKMEAGGQFQSNAMRPKGAASDAMKVRVGKVGGYKGHLTAADLAFIDRMAAEIGDPLGSLVRTSDPS